MINLDRLEQAIAIMERAGNLYMGGEFQTGDVLFGTEEELHACGNSACFAGWIAVSPEFQAAGGCPDYDGSPSSSETAGEAVAAWLETDNVKAVNLLIYGEAWGADESFLKVLEKHSIPFCSASDGHCTVLEDWKDYTAQDVIKYLNALKDLVYSK